MKEKVFFSLGESFITYIYIYKSNYLLVLISIHINSIADNIINASELIIDITPNISMNSNVFILFCFFLIAHH